MREVRRGDIYLAELNPVIGPEQGGTRPVLIVQNNIINKYAPTTANGLAALVPET
jgi:mRNA interferase MazF